MLELYKTGVLALAVSLVLAPGCAGGAPSSATQEDVETSPLFPEIEPYDSGQLKVSELHSIYYEQVGNPEGEPVMILHGGPGVGVYPQLRRYFDPERFRMVLHSQRGCRGSEPFGELRENTTQNLVADIEALRAHLDLGEVVLFGGSWGSTLGLAYAETHPDAVRRLILRGVFLASQEEVDHHYHATALFYPEEHRALLEALPDASRGADPAVIFDVISTAGDEAAAQVLDALSFFELRAGSLENDPQQLREWLATWPIDAKRALSRIDLHYVRNLYFLEPGQLLRDAAKLAGIPTVIINGRYDMLCPPKAAWDLHRAIPGSELVIVEAAGHSEREPGITAALVEAANRSD